MMISSCTTLYSCLHQILHDIVNRRSERTPSAVLMMMMTMASNHHHHHCHHNNCHHHDDHHHRHDDDDHRHQRLFTMKHQGVKLPMRRLERKSRGKVSEVINEKRHKVSTPNGNVKKCQHWILLIAIKKVCPWNLFVHLDSTLLIVVVCGKCKSVINCVLRKVLNTKGCWSQFQPRHREKCGKIRDG